jgi:hypothetical protein
MRDLQFCRLGRTLGPPPTPNDACRGPKMAGEMDDQSTKDSEVCGTHDAMYTTLEFDRRILTLASLAAKCRSLEFLAILPQLLDAGHPSPLPPITDRRRADKLCSVQMTTMNRPRHPPARPPGWGSKGEAVQVPPVRAPWCWWVEPHQYCSSPHSAEAVAYWIGSQERYHGDGIICTQPAGSLSTTQTALPAHASNGHHANRSGSWVGPDLHLPEF